METLGQKGKILLEARPHAANTLFLMNACLLGVAVNTKKPGWLDWICLAMAFGNLAFYLYRWVRWRRWARRRDAWVKQVAQTYGVVDG